jgi:hypothetical protein
MKTILLWMLGYLFALLVMAFPYIIAYAMDMISNPGPGNSAGGGLWPLLFISVPVGAILLAIVAIGHTTWLIKKFSILGALGVIPNVALLVLVVGSIFFVYHDFTTPFHDLSRHDYKNPSALYDNKPLIFLSVQSRRIEDVEKLLSYGHPIEARGFNRETPLLAAAISNQWEMVLFLLEQGADYTAQSGSGDRIFTLHDFLERSRKRDDSYYKVKDWLESEKNRSLNTVKSIQDDD